MAGVVAQLLHVRRDLLRQPVVLLQIDGEICLRASAANLGQRGHVFGIVHRDADDVGAGCFQQLDLPDGGRDVLRAGGGHRLHGDGIGAADVDVSDADLSGFPDTHGFRD